MIVNLLRLFNFLTLTAHFRWFKNTIFDNHYEQLKLNYQIRQGMLAKLLH